MKLLFLISLRDLTWTAMAQVTRFQTQQSGTNAGLFFLKNEAYSPPSEHSKLALSTEQRARLSTLIIDAS